MTESKISALMYSGRLNPEKELSQEEQNHLQQLISQLTNKTNFPMHSQLGFTGFLAFSNDQNNFRNSYGFLNGTVYLWDDYLKDWIGYWDTAGVCAYMFLIMNDTLQQHYQG